MSTATKTTNRIYDLLPKDIEGFHTLAELALDLRWSWNRAADEVWREKSRTSY